MRNRYYVELDCHFFCDEVDAEKAVERIKDFFHELQMELGEGDVKDLTVTEVCRQDFGRVVPEKIYDLREGIVEYLFTPKRSKNSMSDFQVGK